MINKESALDSAAALAADARACDVERRMRDDERLAFVISIMGPNGIDPVRDGRIPAGATLGAGYVPGVPRLDVPALQMSDASLGITNPGYRPGDTATALPAGLALGASFNRALARRAGILLGREARARGFNVVLGGGMNLVRDPRNGRNFEYLSEDVLLSASLAAETVIGTQSERVLALLKHFSLNANEHNRHWLDARIDPAAHQESDLLAFQIAIERAQPAAIMTAYNKVNGEYAGGNDYLLNGVLKNAWHYPGFVISDWGAVHSWDYACKGLDQESGVQLDVLMNGAEWFGEPLRAALARGDLPKERLSDMVRRILRSIYAVGLDQPLPQPVLDMAEHHAIALDVARQGIVLLKNDGALPIRADTPTIAVIGGYAQLGVVTGAGSSAVVPPGGFAAEVSIGGEGIMASGRNVYLLPSSPLTALRKVFPGAAVQFDPGMFAAQAAALARQCDVAIVLPIRPESEGFDAPDLSLPWGQDALIEAVAAANSNTVVVLETGNPVAMPWLPRVNAILAAWFPGQAGGEAIAEILAGTVNPSGRLPLTFPADIAQTPRPDAPGLGVPWGVPVTVDYHEGADVGYRWFAKQAQTPLFAFGHGLSYTTFVHRDLRVAAGEELVVSATVTNAGDRAGADVLQFYLIAAAGEAQVRLIAFERVELQPGESRTVTAAVEQRLLARFDARHNRWRIEAGTYKIALGRTAEDFTALAEVTLPARSFGV